MVRRTESKAKTIDRVFPIRIRAIYDAKTLPGLLEAIENWAVENLGRGRVATHTRSMESRRECVLYFRSLKEAEQCFTAFEELEFRDWVSLTNLENEGRDYGVFSDLRSRVPPS